MLAEQVAISDSINDFGNELHFPEEEEEEGDPDVFTSFREAQEESTDMLMARFKARMSKIREGLTFLYFFIFFLIQQKNQVSSVRLKNPFILRK